MIIIHATYADHHLHFWGEKPVDDLEGAALAAGNKRVTRFPYDAGEDTLKEILVDTLFDRSIRRQEGEMRTVWLPTSGDTAISSSPLLSKNPVAHRDVSLKPWKVTTMTLSLESTIGFLAAFVDKELIGSGIMGGADLAFWTKVMRFSGALVARQEYLPGLERTMSGQMEAIWEPIFLGDDLEYLNELIEAMPHSCGCMQSEKDSTSDTPQIYPATMVKEVILQIVDYLARYSIFTQPQSSWPKSFLSEPGTEFDSMHDHWLNALVTEDPILPDAPEDLEDLYRQVRHWRKPISLSTATPFRLCLKLEEPPSLSNQDPGDSADWFVHFCLQSLSDPDLRIPAEHVWKPSPEEAKVLNTDYFDAKEFLLSSLGIASTICPRIEDSLRQDAPTGYPLDTTGAYEFLTHRLLALEQAGFGTVTPGWWTHDGTRERLGTRAVLRNPSPPQKQKQSFSLDQILEFTWEITLDGQKVSRSELESLANADVPLVNMRGHWIQLGEHEIEHAIELTDKDHIAKASLRKIVRMALGAAKSEGDFPFDGVEAEGWVHDFLQQLQGGSTFELLDPPKQFVGELRPYQTRGYSWLAFLRKWGLGACLADDMGLGKTIQALALIQREWEDGFRKPYLIICPTSLTGNWHKEARKFTPELPVLVHHGVNRNKGSAFKKEAEKYAIIISSYSLLHRDIEILKTIEWGGTILDEAQNIKNPKTKQARSARSIKAENRIALTGTPVENNVGDLWSIMEFLNSGFLGSQADFKRNFMLPIQANRDPETIGKLKTLTNPFILRRLKSDKSIIKDLPSKMEMKVYCNLGKEQAKLYEDLVQDVETALESTDGIQRKGLVLATLTKLKQICNHPAQYLNENKKLDNRSGKLSRLAEMLEEVIELDERALIFTQFVEMGKIIQQHLQDTFGQEVIFMHGGVSKKARDKMIDRFQEEHNGPHIFVLSLKAGGTGLNLTRANHVFHYDRWWNPAVEDQATDRVYRIGQTRNVQIHKFLCAGTLEERIDEMLEHKKGVADSIVTSDESWLTELSTDELKNLFQLQKDAVGE